MAAHDPREKKYNAEFIARTQDARIARGWTQDIMASHLGVPLERYKKYETRSPMPIFLMPTFAALANITLEFLLTGHKPPKPRKK